MDAAMKEQVSPALGAIPSGCCIATAGDAKSGRSLLASWVQQCSFDPPMVTLCVKNGRPIEAVIDKSGHFVVNVIGENAQPMLDHFGKGFGPGEPAFEGVNTKADAAGVILNDCLGWLACKVACKHAAGDHAVYVGQVLRGGTRGSGKPHVHIRRNGFNY